MYDVHTMILTGTQPLDGVMNAAVWEVGSGATDVVGGLGYGGCRLRVEVSAPLTAVGQACLSALRQGGENVIGWWGGKGSVR